MERKKVYELIDGEREYQALRWNEDTTSTGGFHSVTEFLVYIRDYTEEALHVVSRNDEPKASEEASHILRKIAALAVACMEQNGSFPRDMEDIKNRLFELSGAGCFTPV